MKNIKEVFKEPNQNSKSIGLKKYAIKPNQLKYHLIVEWPGTCRNRSAKTLQSRPDLVHQMNEYTKKLIAVCSVYKNTIQIDQDYNMMGVRTWWKAGSDLYDFLLHLKEHNFQVIPEIGVINNLSQQLILFKLQINGNDVTVF